VAQQQENALGKPEAAAKSRSRGWGKAVKSILPFLAAVASLLLVWEVWAILMNKPFVLPHVSQVFEYMFNSVTE